MPIGSNIRDLNPVDLRSHIAMAIQSPGMKVDSIRANCIYGSEKMFEVNNHHRHDQNELAMVFVLLVVCSRELDLVVAKATVSA